MTLLLSDHTNKLIFRQVVHLYWIFELHSHYLSRVDQWVSHKYYSVVPPSFPPSWSPHNTGHVSVCSTGRHCPGAGLGLDGKLVCVIFCRNIRTFFIIHRNCSKRISIIIHKFARTRFCKVKLNNYIYMKYCVYATLIEIISRKANCNPENIRTTHDKLTLKYIVSLPIYIQICLFLDQWRPLQADFSYQ